MTKTYAQEVAEMRKLLATTELCPKCGMRAHPPDQWCNAVKGEQGK